MACGRWCLVGLVLVLALGSPAWAEEAGSASVEDDEYADSDRATLIVRKFVKNDTPLLLVHGRNVTVMLDIYNSGTRYKSSCTRFKIP